MPSTISLHAECTAALDDLLERRDHQFAAVEAETFGAGELDVAEFLETVGLDQLVEDGALAFAREADLLVGSFDALLDPALLGTVGDVQEFDAERLAIGALQDRDDLAHGSELQAEDVIQENLAVHVGVGEAIGARIEFLLVLARLKPERIQIGVEVPARPIGADQHQRVDGVARGLLHLGRRELDAFDLGFGLDLVADRPLGFPPIAVER